MRRRVKLRGKKYIFKNRKNFLMVVFILIIISIIFVIRLINLKISPVLLNYGEIESRKLAGIIINDAVSKNMEIDVEELFLITRENDEIKTIDFNPIVVNKILTKITSDVQTNLKYVEQGKIEELQLNKELINYNPDLLKKGIVYEIPGGVIFGYSVLANIGPKIPVKFNLIGDIVGYINTDVTNYGINNALIEVNIVLELSEQVILPFTAKKIKINTSVPIALKLVQGNIPEYYINGLGSNSPSLSLPIE